MSLESTLYSTAIRLYGAGIKLAGMRNQKAALLSAGQKGVWNKLENRFTKEDRVIWIHAASLGEFEQGRPLIEMIKQEMPEYKVLLTFFSPSGYEVRKNYNLADCVCYLPLDTPGKVKRFLNLVNPEMAIFVKYEFWRNYLAELSKRGIPTYLISAVFRPDQLFFKPYGKWYAKWLNWYKYIYLQDERSQKLLKSIGVDNTAVYGDTRFDRVADIRSTRKEIPLLEKFTNHSDPDHTPVIMAGSSWPQDEAVYAEWINSHPDIKLVVAPHEFDAKRLESLKRLFTNGAVLLSEADKDNSILDKSESGSQPQVLIIDCFGMLSSAYAYCDVAYVGGAFGAGLHNINEPAVYDVPVIYGPNNQKFIEAREMAESGGGFPISGKEDFNRIADTLLYSPEQRKSAGLKAGNYIRSKTGATKLIYSSLFK